MIRSFPVGSKVLLTTPCATLGERKSGPKRHGPFLIVARLPDVTENYVLRCCKTYKQLKNAVHPNRLSYFYSDENDLYKAADIQDTDYEAPPTDMLQAYNEQQVQMNCPDHQPSQDADPIVIIPDDLGNGEDQQSSQTQLYDPGGETQQSQPQTDLGGDNQALSQADPGGSSRTVTQAVIPQVTVDDNDNTVNTDDINDTNDTWYTAEKLLKMRRRDGKRQFWVKWEDPDAKNSWENEEDVTEALKDNFFIAHTLKGEKRKRR